MGVQKKGARESEISMAFFMAAKRICRSALRQKVAAIRTARFVSASKRHMRVFSNNPDVQEEHFGAAFSALASRKVDWKELAHSMKFIRLYLKSLRRVSSALEKSIRSEKAAGNFNSGFESRAGKVLAGNKEQILKIERLLETLEKRRASDSN